MKASAFRRWPVAGAYSPEQTTRLTGGSDSATFHYRLEIAGCRFGFVLLLLFYFVECSKKYAISTLLNY